MPKIYLDNSCTSFPKAPGTAEAISQLILSGAVNVNRSSYQMAAEAEDLLFECRHLLCSLFSGPGEKNVLFTSGVTESLNTVLKGYLRPGDHVLTSSMEHNAVMRPLVELSAKGISFTRIPCSKTGELLTGEMENLLRDNTKMVVITAASNVCGTKMPLAEVGEFCRRHHLKFVVDTAQAAGSVPLSMKDLGIDALCFTGHKGLLGPQGIGGFLLTDEMARETAPLLSGGTGSVSHLETMPSFLPDKFEAGTLNLPGIAGLFHSVRWLSETGIPAVHEREMQLTDRFLRGIRPLCKEGLLSLCGLPDTENRVSCVSVVLPEQDMGEAAMRLDSEYGIMIRSGLHCAPSAHKTLGTFPEGTLRFSFGYFTREEEIDAAVSALSELVLR